MKCSLGEGEREDGVWMINSQAALRNFQILQIEKAERLLYSARKPANRAFCHINAVSVSVSLSVSADLFSEKLLSVP